MTRLRPALSRLALPAVLCLGCRSAGGGESVGAAGTAGGRPSAGVPLGTYRVQLPDTDSAGGGPRSPIDRSPAPTPVRGRDREPGGWR